MTSSSGALGVREFAGMRFRYRIGSVDEQVLEDQYHARRFFAGRYHPRESDRIVDAGAHIGSFTVLAARRVPLGAVYALEPAQENFDILHTNIVSNSITNASAHKAALSAASGTVRLYHAPQSWGHTLRGPHPTGDVTFEEVTTQTLDEFMSEQKIESIDYLKMNIEGAEYEVFLHAPPNVLQRIGFMLVELHPAEDEVVRELLARLAAERFSTDVVWSDDPAVKGWLTASRSAS